MYMLKMNNKDTLFILRIGYKNGFNISNLFNLGDLNILKFQEIAIDEAKN